MKMDQRKRELQKNVRQGYKLIGKEPQNALTYFKKAYKEARDLEDDKLERTCAFNLGALYIAQGQSKEGVEYLLKAIPPENEKDDKSNGDVYFNLGLGYEKMASSATVTEQDIHRKKAINNYRKAADEYESERNSARQTECLEKILELQGSGSVDEHLRAYDDLIKLLDKEEQLNKQMFFLCKKANFLRLKKKIKEAEQAADDCLNVNEKVGECTDETTACTLNELGLLYTQIQQYEKATKCFEQALPIIRTYEGKQEKLEAVILQNLGAAYNFVGDYQRSKTFHLQAAEKFAKLRNRHSQGQCFANLAFAHSQLGDNDGAWEYFVLARQAAEDSGDVSTIWQVHEGLGSVQFKRGDMEKAEEYFTKALKELGNKNEDAFNRIVSKLKNVHEIQLLNQQFPGTRRLPGGSFVQRSFGPQQRRGFLSGTQNRSRIDPDEPQPEDTEVRETTVQPASEPPPVIYENHFYEGPVRRVIPVERDSDLPDHHQRVNRGFSFHSGELMPAKKRAHNVAETTSDSDDTSSDSNSTGSDDEPTYYTPKILPVHANQGSMRHKYETLLEQREKEEDETEGKETTESDEESNRKVEDENHGREPLRQVSKKPRPAGSPDVNTYENIKPREPVTRQKSDSSSDDMGQGTLTGSGPYAEVDFSTKASSRNAGNDNSKESQMPKSRNLSKDNFLPSDEDDEQSSEQDDEQSSEQDETGNVSPRQGPSAERSQRKSDSSFETEEYQHTPRGESEKYSYQVHRQLREKEAKDKETKETKEEGKSSKTCILM